MRLPDIAEDRNRSPYTGWTRAHWEAVTDATLAAVRPYASPGHALIRLPGPASASGPWSDGLEGYARTFLAAAFRLAAGPSGDLAEWYAQGLAAGVDPDSAERWPSVVDTPQAKVEAASIALALHETRAVLWDELPDRVREQTVEWLAGVLGQHYPACNWLWFQSIVEAFLRSVGGPWSAEDLDDNEAAIERWYLGAGWYTDGLSGVDTAASLGSSGAGGTAASLGSSGAGGTAASLGSSGAGGTARNFDWYAGWAMHVYPLWYGRISGEVQERHRERLRRYLDTARHLFAPDGPPVHQGRSMTYRFAALAPLWVGAIFDATPLSPGETRRLASGTLRHFVSAGAWDADGLQPIGWYGAFEPIRQPYSGPGSPYWSSKGLAGLVLAADHPVWTAVEEPLAVERDDVSLALPVPGWLVSATRADGVVRVVNHGADHADARVPTADDPGYARFAYATHAGPEYGGQARHSPLDNHVALVDAEGVAAHRSPLVPLGVSGRVGASRFRAHWPTEPVPDRGAWPPRQPAFRPGPWVTTASVLRGPVEIRLVRVGSGADGCVLRIGGYALAADEMPPTRVAGARAEAWRADGLCSIVVGLCGLPDAAVHRFDGANAYGRHSVVPAVSTSGPVVEEAVYAAGVVLAAGAAGLPEVLVEGAHVTVRWPDGETDEVDL